MSSLRSLQQFQSAVNRFLEAKAKVLATWASPCHCDSLGGFVECQHCPYFKGYVLRLQAHLDVPDRGKLPAVTTSGLKPPYSSEVKQQCLELCRIGFSMGEILHLTGVTNRKTLKRWFYAEGLLPKARHISPEIRQQCLELYADGLSARKIEDRMQVGAELISSWVSQEGIRRPRPNYSEEQRQECLHLYRQGMRVKEIEETTQVNGPSIKRWAKLEGLYRNPRRQRGRPPVYDSAFREECLQLLDEGRTVVQIAIEKGVSNASIRQWKRESEQWAAYPTDANDLG
jgi:transposase-like protein